MQGYRPQSPKVKPTAVPVVYIARRVFPIVYNTESFISSHLPSLKEQHPPKSITMEATQALKFLKMGTIAIPFALSGFSFSASYINVNNLVDLPLSQSAPIFSKVYHHGATIMGPGSVSSFCASMYLAYVIPSQRMLWATAGISTISILPFTMLVMLPGINRVLAAVGGSQAEREKVAESEGKELLRTWVKQNYVRTTLLFAGGMTALAGTVL